MDAYIYQAAVYCEECGKAIRERLTQEGNAPSDPDDETTYDSDEYPKGPYPDGSGESDCPQHCDDCHVFLENPLTSHGVEYVIESHRDRPTEISQTWVDYYGLSDRFIDDGDIIGAIQPIYQLNWAGIAEENGESFSGCEITDVCPEGPTDNLLKIGRDWIRSLESAYGSLADTFKRIGLSELDHEEALYHLFMQSIGHGVGFTDYAWENDCENPFKPTLCHLDDSAVWNLADIAYNEVNNDETDD